MSVINLIPTVVHLYLEHCSKMLTCTSSLTRQQYWWWPLMGPHSRQALCICTCVVTS